MILDEFGTIVLAFNKNSILFIRHNGNVLFDFCSAKEMFVWPCNDSVLLMFFDDVEVNNGECRVDLNAVDVLEDIVATDISLWSQSYFDSNFVLGDTVIVNFEFELLSYTMDSYRVFCDSVFYNSWGIVTNAPYENTALTVLAYYWVLQLKLTQFADDSYGLFLRVTLYLAESHREKSFLLNADRRNYWGTWFHQITQR